MKSKRLLLAMEDIKDEFIEAAAPKEKKKPTALWVKICAAAACIALIVAVGAGMLYEKPQALPMLELDNIFDGGMSMEAHFAYSADELINSNPWSAENSPKKLTVYKNTAYTPSGAEMPQTDFMNMKNVLLEAAEKLGVRVSEADIETSETAISVEKDKVKITLNAWLMLNVYISGENVLPDGYTLDCYAGFDEISKTAEYLKNKYSAFLGMKNPQADISMGDYNVLGRRNFSLAFYDADSDIEKSIENYNFGRVSFSVYDDGTLHISQSVGGREPVGNYPIISPGEATELLEQGEYYTSVFIDFPGVQAVKKVELVYCKSSVAKTFVPYYRFYIEVEHEGTIAEDFPGMKSFGTYYVPAVEGKYISDHRAELFQ